MSFLISSVVSGVTSGFTGKVARVYLFSFALVFVTFLFAKIVGAAGEVLFTLAYWLTMVEIFGVPVAFIVVASFILNIVMPFLVLPMIELGVDVLIFGFNLVTFTLLQDFLRNPFRGLHRFWIPLDPEPYVTLLMNVLETLRVSIINFP